MSKKYLGPRMKLVSRPLHMVSFWHEMNLAGLYIMLIEFEFCLSFLLLHAI